MMKAYDIYPLRLGAQTYINYTYIIVDRASQQAAIVDPAWNLSAICEKLDELGAELTTILLTHSHYDHVNLVEPLVMRYQAEVYCSVEEVQFSHFGCKNLNLIQDLDLIVLGQTKITCLLTPGHTAGGICYLLQGDMCTGDTLFIEGCGICDTAGGCPNQMYDSMQRLKKLVAPHVRIYPGHSFGEPPGQPFRYLLANNIYFQLNEKEQFVNFRMRKNQKHHYQFR